jgi:hypothetical protein
MVSGTGVLVPIGVNAIGSMNFFVCIIIIGISRPAILCIMPLFVADLASDIYPGCGAATSTPTTTATSWIATATTTALVGTIIPASIAAIISTAITAVITARIVVVVAIIGGARAPLPGHGIGGGFKLRFSRAGEQKLTLIIGVDL